MVRGKAARWYLRLVHIGPRCRDLGMLRRLVRVLGERFGVPWVGEIVPPMAMFWVVLWCCGGMLV